MKFKVVGFLVESVSCEVSTLERIFDGWRFFLKLNRVVFEQFPIGEIFPFFILLNNTKGKKETDKKKEREKIKVNSITITNQYSNRHFK